MGDDFFLYRKYIYDIIMGKLYCLLNIMYILVYFGDYGIFFNRSNIWYIRLC